jgi:hypothetical protein
MFVSVLTQLMASSIISWASCDANCIFITPNLFLPGIVFIEMRLICGDFSKEDVKTGYRFFYAVILFYGIIWALIYIRGGESEK